MNKTNIYSLSDTDPELDHLPLPPQLHKQIELLKI